MIRGTRKSASLFFVSRSAWAPLGALICFDIEFPEAARAVVVLGAWVLAVCNGNMAPYGHVHRTMATTRALQNQMFVAMAYRVGAGRTDTFAGGSLIADPEGNILAEADGASETVIPAEIDLAQIERARATYDYLALRRVRMSGKAESFSGRCVLPDTHR
jgi:(R)-amidase